MMPPTKDASYHSHALAMFILFVFRRPVMTRHHANNISMTANLMDEPEVHKLKQVFLEIRVEHRSSSLERRRIAVATAIFIGTLILMAVGALAVGGMYLFSRWELEAMEESERRINEVKDAVCQNLGNT